MKNPANKIMIFWSNFWWCLPNLKEKKQILKQENETILRKMENYVF